MELPAFLLNLQWEAVKINVKDTAWALFRLKLLLCAFPSCGPNSPHSLHFDWNICQQGPPIFQSILYQVFCCFTPIFRSVSSLFQVVCTHTPVVCEVLSVTLLEVNQYVFCLQETSPPPTAPHPPSPPPASPGVNPQQRLTCRSTVTAHIPKVNTTDQNTQQ